MKKLLLVSIACLTLASCNPTSSLNSVRNAFPDSEVSAIPQREYLYAIRKPNGSIWIIAHSCSGDVPYSGQDATYMIPQAIQIFPPNK